MSYLRSGFCVLLVFTGSIPRLTPERLPGQAERSQVIAFTRVNVVPMTGPAILPDQTVLVERGRITAVGPRPQVSLPPGTVVI